MDSCCIFDLSSGSVCLWVDLWFGSWCCSLMLRRWMPRIVRILRTLWVSTSVLEPSSNSRRARLIEMLTFVMSHEKVFAHATNDRRGLCIQPWISWWKPPPFCQGVWRWLRMRLPYTRILWITLLILLFKRSRRSVTLRICLSNMLSRTFVPAEAMIFNSRVTPNFVFIHTLLKILLSASFLSFSAIIWSWSWSTDWFMLRFPLWSLCPSIFWDAVDFSIISLRGCFSLAPQARDFVEDFLQQHLLILLYLLRQLRWLLFGMLFICLWNILLPQPIFSLVWLLQQELHVFVVDRYLDNLVHSPFTD